MIFTQLRDFARETIYRNKLAQPITEQEMEWFNEGNTLESLKRIELKCRMWQTQPNGTTDIELVEAAVCEQYQLTSEQLRTRTRRRAIVEARHVAMYFTTRLTTISLARIGAYFGGYDHATVLYACKTVENLKATERQYAERVLQVKHKLQLEIK